MKNLYFSLLPDAEKAKYKTEKQWFKLGFVPVSQDAGTIMYSNRFCTGKYRYLTSEEVRKATNEEMTPYHEEQRRKRRSRYLQSKKEREQAIRYGELLSLCDQQRQLDEENYRGTIPTLTVSIDIETTGLDFNQDEILQVSILDIDTGEVLLDSYVKPYFTEDWPEARRVNHITKEMVCNAPYIYELLPRLNQVLAQVKTIVGYNFTGFDNGFLTRYGASFNDETIVEDLSNIFAAIYGEFSPKHGDFKFKNLSTCADYFGYDWGEETATTVWQIVEPQRFAIKRRWKKCTRNFIKRTSTSATADFSTRAMMRVVITMAEFCLDCFNRMNGTHYKEKQVWLEEYLCEGCAEWKPCVMQLYPKPIICRIVDFAKNNTKRDGK